jgi:hypothetical protein
VSLDDPKKVRHNVVLSNWQIDVPVRPDVFTLLKPDGPRRLNSTEAHPVGTSGIQGAAQVRPLWLHTFSAKYWGASAPAVALSPYANYFGGNVQTTPSAATTYYQSPDGWGYYPPSYYGYSSPATAGYSGAPCVDCVAWPTEGGVDTTPGSFDISLATSGWYDASAAATDYNQQGATYPPGQIVTSLPVGCAAPYTRGAAFYLCGDTWFSAVYAPDGTLYYRAITVP